MMCGIFIHPYRCSLLRGQQLAAISDISQRDGLNISANERGRQLDLVLPKDARIFMADMTGPLTTTSLGIIIGQPIIFSPARFGMSLDHITRITMDSFLGQTSESDQEILAHGFDVRMDMDGNSMISKSLHNISIRDPVNPDWFDSYFDLIIAFLLPLLTALAECGCSVFLFPTLSERMPLLEQLACSLGLGMMAVAALTLGVKLCGFHGGGVILSLIALGSVAEIWRYHKAFWEKIADSYGS